jgi:saccharopine dehydrogenase-like NADP-dependent oxidoreductase
VKVAVVGAGLVGSRVAQNLRSRGIEPAVVRRGESTGIADADWVVLASPSPHHRSAHELCSAGVSVVSVSDDLEDIMRMLDMDVLAREGGARLVVGAGCAPGMSGLLVRHVNRGFDRIDEVHVAVHGTAGPACARQHHRNLAGIAIGWHDGEWIERPAGSGRELCWFPDPVGAHDCYRHASGEPLLLQKVAPELTRITARTSATRRDRLTARLPMMSPPHAEGGIGGLRVEVRGWREGVRHVEIVGMAERIASVAASVAANVVTCTGAETPPGVHVTGGDHMPNDAILDAVLAGGFTLHQFVGN